MRNKFEWERMYKWEDNYEQEIANDVRSQISEHYGVEDEFDLTKEQIQEVEEFRESMNEYSVMYSGFTAIIDSWYSEYEDDF